MSDIGASSEVRISYKDLKKGIVLPKLALLSIIS
nr:MAG TPA: hypothetical protein [Caudoviricetes sp.]DAI58447.1 MAG TPA: hypothetical protein [Crassvirales sp.]DAP51490.1 MAG TPA: hypothetical protein [Caudoviricetes sp.]